MDGLPVQAAGFGLPVLVADRGPHILEGLNIELALLGSERRTERSCNVRNAAAIAKPRASFSSFLLENLGAQRAADDGQRRQEDEQHTSDCANSALNLAGSFNACATEFEPASFAGNWL